MATTEPAAPHDLEAWSYDVVLADGGTVHLRPIQPDDGERLGRLHGRLSSESIYYRFFSPKPRLTDKEVERFVTVDMHDRAALVAVLGDEIIGVGRYDRWQGKDEAEVAFTVDDAHQGRGIATLLLEHLAAFARTRGISRFTAEVLPDNRGMLTTFRRAGFEVKNEFSGGVVDVAFDIDPTPAFLETVERRERRAEARSIARLLRPRTVAVIGASDRVGSVGRAVFRNLLAFGFDGPVYPVNPTTTHVASVPTHATVLDIPDDIHLAVVAVPAAEVQPVIESCARKGVRGVIVVSTGFSDAGPEGSEAERHLVEFARGNGMRLIGPASMGLVSTIGGSCLYASFATAPVAPGRVGISIQSGPLGMAMVDLAHRLGLGVSSVVSLGNKADVSANDLLNYWDEDPDTDVVLLYTESFGNPRKFGRIARRVSKHKPIVAVKAGRLDDTDDVAADALYQQAGVIRVSSVRHLFDTARLLASQPLPAGPHVAVVANALSPAILTLDSLAAAGLAPARLSVDTRSELSHRLPAQAKVGDAIDLTFRATAADYGHALAAVLADPGVDAVITVYAPPIAGGLDEVAAAITELAAAHDKPVLAVTLGRDDGPVASDSAVPAYAFPEQAAASLGRVLRYARWRRRPEGEVPELPVDFERASAIVAHALEVRPEGTLLPLSVTADLLDAFGIPFAPARAVVDVEGAVRAAAAVGYPVAVKAAGIERLARSESGGVALDVQDEEELREAYERMSVLLGRGMAEAIVQRMVPAGVETIVTVENHEAFGPVVGFGLGGAFADAIADRSVRSLPLTDADAASMVAASRASDALRLAGGDVSSVEDVLLRVGLLADSLHEVVRVWLNPVLVSSEAAWAVDARVHVAPVPASPYELPLRRL